MPRSAKSSAAALEQPPPGLCLALLLGRHGANHIGLPLYMEEPIFFSAPNGRAGPGHVGCRHGHRPGSLRRPLRTCPPARVVIDPGPQRGGVVGSPVRRHGRLRRRGPRTRRPPARQWRHHRRRRPGGVGPVAVRLRARRRRAGHRPPEPVEAGAAAGRGRSVRGDRGRLSGAVSRSVQHRLHRGRHRHRRGGPPHLGRDGPRRARPLPGPSWRSAGRRRHLHPQPRRPLRRRARRGRPR